VKTNETVLRSPKWMRNFADFEIATGKDIKGEPSVKMKAKLAKEKAEKEEAERLAKEEREKKEREEFFARRKREKEAAEERKKAEKEREEIEFNALFSTVIAFIYKNYTTCEFSIPSYNYFAIEKNSEIHINNNNLTFKITLDNTIRMPKFEVFITCKNKTYSYNVTSLNYADFKIFLLNTVYEYYKVHGSNKKEEKKEQQKRGDWKKEQKKSYDEWGGNYDWREKQEPPRQRAGAKPNQQHETDPMRNRLRRLALLRQTLEGYERQLSRMSKGDPERETIMNEIANIKRRINEMGTRKNENLKHLKSFKLFEKYCPNVGDTVNIVYHVTGEPTPVKIKKILRDGNGYIASFDVPDGKFKGAPDQKISNSDIIGPAKMTQSPVGTGYISTNTNMSIRQVHQVSNDMYL